MTDPRKTRSRTKILDAATGLLITGGAQAVTIDAVCDHSGVAKSTIYRHFSSHVEMLVEVLRHNLPSMDYLALQPTFEASLRRLAHGLAEMLGRPEQRRAVPALFALRNSEPHVDQLAQADHQQRIRMLGKVIDQGMDEGILSAGIDPEAAANFLVGPLVFACMTPGHTDLKQTADQVIDLFLTSSAFLAASPPNHHPL